MKYICKTLLNYTKIGYMHPLKKADGAQFTGEFPHDDQPIGGLRGTYQHLCRNLYTITTGNPSRSELSCICSAWQFMIRCITLVTAYTRDCWTIYRQNKPSSSSYTTFGNDETSKQVNPKATPRFFQGSLFNKLRCNGKSRVPCWPYITWL